MYNPDNAQFVLSAFYKQNISDSDVSQPEIYKDHNITSLKKFNVSRSNISEIAKLPFKVEDINSLKKFTQNSVYMRISGIDLAMMSKDSKGALECKLWNVTLHYNFVNLNEVTENFEIKYTQCKADKYFPEYQKILGFDNPIQVQEIFTLNIISTLANAWMSIYIISVAIEVFKYNNLKNEKIEKYKWLARNNKKFNFDVKILIIIRMLFER